MARVSEEYYELKKKEIIDAAFEVCKRKTVSSVTMQDVIDQSGMSQGAIYRYFKNIDEILTGLLSRIHIEQYESIDRLNKFIDENTTEIVELRKLPVTPQTITMRRKLLVRQLKLIHDAWAEEIQKYLYPHKKIELEFLMLADNFPERARNIFPNAAPGREIDSRIFAALNREVEDGVIHPCVPLEEFMEYNASVYTGIIQRAISQNCLHRNKDFDESNSYDIKKRFETFAVSSMLFLGIGEDY